MIGAASALCSSAWACAVLAGKMVVSGNAGTGTVTAIGDGNQNDYAWCPGYPSGKAKATRGGSVTITVSKSGTLGCATGSRPARLDAGTYNVNYLNGPAFTRSHKADTDNSDGSRTWRDHCLYEDDTILDQVLPDTEPEEGIVRIGTMTVNEFGKGNGTYAIPATGVTSGPTDEAAVCVYARGLGNMVPLTIV